MNEDSNRPVSQFATTQWTLVWKAAEEDSQHGRPALAEVIRRYWRPLYGFARYRGLSSEDAEDATQEFLSSILDGRLLDEADPAKGKFRTYLLTAWKRFLVDEYRKKNAVKRGGEAKILSLDVPSGEDSFTHLQSKTPDPDQAFMVGWANSLLEDVKERLRNDYVRRDKAAVFDLLFPMLTHKLDASQYLLLSKQLAVSNSAVKVAMHRLRQRFGSCLRDAVQETIDDPQEIDAEINELLKVFALRNN